MKKYRIDVGYTDGRLWAGAVVMAVNNCIDSKKATKYLSEDLVVKCSRHGKSDNRMSRRFFVVTMGKPNFEDRKFISKCKKAGEPFPVKKIQMKY